MRVKRVLLIALVISTIALALVTVVACDGGFNGFGGYAHQHTFSDEWDWDENEHWHPANCEHSDERFGVEKHELDSDGLCKCGYRLNGDYKVTFVADGQTVEVVTYKVGDTKITEPQVPLKERYYGEWDNYVLKNRDIIVEAIYTPIEYSITFVADSYSEVVTYNIETVEQFIAPEIPDKVHYYGEWQQFELNFSDCQFVYAQYTPIEYCITFEADDFSQQYTYTEESIDSFEKPHVPEKQYYTGAWEFFEFLYTNEQTVHAEYTPINYSIVFETGDFFQRYFYTVETIDNFNEPDVPLKEHYTGKWEDYQLSFSLIQYVYAQYTPIEYTITYVTDDFTQQLTYTVENWNNLDKPEVPIKHYYVGKWQDYSPQYNNDQIVKAEYTPIVYKVTFVFEYEETEIMYTIETMEKVIAPQEPEKVGYLCDWDEYELEFDDSQKVYGRYVAKTYTLKLEYGEASGDIDTFNIDFDEMAEGLPQPEVYGKEFWGWFYNEILIDKNTRWVWDDSNIMLTARFLNTQGVIYELSRWYNTDFCRVVGYNHLDGIKDIVLLDTYKGVPVKEIGSNAFAEATITSITISNSITIIGTSAFYGCGRLSKIIIPRKVVEIGGYAFSGCINLDTITFEENSQLQCINENAFYGCSEISEVAVPNGVISMGRNVFDGCNSLNKITLPFVGQNSDGTGNTNFDYIFNVIPSSLKTVVITGGTIINSYAFSHCGNLTEIVIPSSVTIIESYAFSYCNNLTEMVIPSSVTIIESYAFRDCRNLQRVTFVGDSQLQSIGDSAFSCCDNLIEITIPNSVTSIGNEAFSGCDNLIEIIIPKSVESINDSAFV